MSDHMSHVYLLSSLGRRPSLSQKIGILLVLVWCCTLPVPAESAEMADRIIAIVNQEVITLSEMKEDIKRDENRLREQFRGADLDRRLRQLELRALTRLIERRLQIQLARQKGHDVTDEEVTFAMRELGDRGEEVDSSDPVLVRTIKEQLTLLKVLDREVRSGVMVSDVELKGYYEDHLTQFMLPKEYRLSQILIRPRPNDSPKETRNRAKAVYAALQKGGDFNDLALRKSDGSEAPRGGHLGFIREGDLDPPIQKALSALNPGDISQPVETDDGYHILRLEEQKPPKFRPYEEVKDVIRNRLYQEKGEAQFHKWINDLKDKAYIEVKFYREPSRPHKG